MEFAEGPTNGTSALPTANSMGPWTIRRPCAEPRQKRTKNLRSFRLLCLQVVVRFITAGRGMGQGSTHRTNRGSSYVHAIPANVKFVREKIAFGNGPSMGAI